jgi:predicted alpha/beta-fold hydrolase
LLCFSLQDLPADAPVLILFPGLTGGSGDSYVQHAVLQARHAGIRAAVFNSRGTADSPVLTPQFYSASFTGDTREVRQQALQLQLQLSRTDR